MYLGCRCSQLTTMASQAVLFKPYFLFFLFVILIAQSLSQSISTTDEQELLKRCPPNLLKSYLKAAPWGTCYEFHTQERTWSSANHVCRYNGGNLVTIKEEKVQNFIYRALIDYRWPRNGLWLGATDSHKEMDWRWVTGERVKDGYSKWARGQPSCGIICVEDCALMMWKEAGKWHDYHCSLLENYSFICEYKMLPVTTTATTTTESTTTESTTESTTTTTTTESTTTSTSSSESTTLSTESTTTVPLLPREMPILESHAHTREEELHYNDSEPAMLSVMVAHQGELSEKTSSSLGQGSLSILIIGTITLLSILILLFILFRRRRRTREKEDEPGVHYANPFYGEAKQPLTSESPSRRFEDSDGEVDLKTKCSDMNFVHEGTSESLVLDPQPPVRTRHVMNHYDKPPTRHHTMTSGPHPEVNPDPVNFYDDINRSLLDGAYDSPRSFNAEKSLPKTPCSETGYVPEDLDFYQNEENIYESVDNLQQRLIGPAMTEARLEDLDDTRYVPFVLDGEKEVVA